MSFFSQSTQNLKAPWLRSTPPGFAEGEGRAEMVKLSFFCNNTRIRKTGLA